MRLISGLIVTILTLNVYCSLQNDTDFKLAELKRKLWDYFHFTDYETQNYGLMRYGRSIRNRSIKCASAKDWNYTTHSLRDRLVYLSRKC